MDLVSWNLNGLEARGLGERTEAALQDILLGVRLHDLASGATPSVPPEVVFLQEVTEQSFHAYLRPHLHAAGFTLHPSRPPDRNHFELCGVRSPFRVLDYQAEPLHRSLFGRWLHRLGLEGPDGRWALYTAHFDSGPEPLTGDARVAQVRDIAAQMEGWAVFAGDTNLRDAEWDAAAVPVCDAWTASGCSAEHRYTWKGHGRKARFDRVWTTSQVRVESFKTVGARPVFGLGETPSDHLGVRVRLCGLP